MEKIVMLDPLYTSEETKASKPLALLQDYSSEASKIEEMKGKIAKTEKMLLKMQIKAKKLIEEREECIRNLIKAIAETTKQRDEAGHQIQLLRCNFTILQTNNIQTAHNNSYNSHDYSRLEKRVGKSRLPEKGKLWDAVIDAGAPLHNSGLLPPQQTGNSGLVFRVNECTMNSVDQSADFGGGDKGWSGSCNELAKIFECPRVRSEEMKL